MRAHTGPCMAQVVSIPRPCTKKWRLQTSPSTWQLLSPFHSSCSCAGLAASEGSVKKNCISLRSLSTVLQSPTKCREGHLHIALLGAWQPIRLIACIQACDGPVPVVAAAGWPVWMHVCAQMVAGRCMLAAAFLAYMYGDSSLLGSSKDSSGTVLGAHARRLLV